MTCPCGGCVICPSGVCVCRPVCQQLAGLPEDRNHDVRYGQVPSVHRRRDWVSSSQTKRLGGHVVFSSLTSYQRKRMILVIVLMIMLL